MKNLCGLVLTFAVIVLLAGCGNVVGIGEFYDFGTASSVIEFGNSTESSTTFSISSSRSIDSNGLKISFRSSDIEFWSTGGNYTNLQSALYGNNGNTSTPVELSDTEGNVAFMPNKVKLEKYEMPNFENGTYDVARMDIGSGSINFTMNGSLMNVENNTLGGGNLNANSIVFVDESILTDVVYINRLMARTILTDYLDNEIVDGLYDFGENTDFIVNFVIENTATWVDGQGIKGKDDIYMDVDGALFVPFTPFAVDGNEKNIKIKIDWDLNTIFESVEPAILSDTADGTPYNFKISVEVQ